MTMSDTTRRSITLVAGLAWLVVGGRAIREGMVNAGDGWEVPYPIYNAALLVGVACTVVIAESLTRGPARPRLRTAGLGVCTVGVLAAFVVAWALALWMVVLGVGLALVAVAATRQQRRSLAILAGAQAIGVAVLLTGILAEVGREDEWGDYPRANGLGLGVTAAAMILALLASSREAGRPFPSAQLAMD